MSEPDPLADLLMEGEIAADLERTERRVLLERITELRDTVSRLADAVDRLTKIDHSERGRSIGTVTVEERDEYGQIVRFTLN